MDGECTGGWWQSPPSNWNVYLADLCWDCPWVNRPLKAQSHNWHGQHLISKENILDPPALRRRICGMEEGMWAPVFLPKLPLQLHLLAQ